MSLSLILQALQAGITNGFIYALVGMGLAVIFRGSRVINVMHGEFSVVAAMTTVLVLNAAKYPYWFAILAGMLTGPAIGALIELTLVRPMIRQQATEDQFVLLTIGLERAIAASVLFWIGRDGYLLPAFGGDHVFIVFDVVVREHSLWLIAIAVLVVVSLREFFRRTTLGLAMTAASIDADGATTTGINVARMRTLTFVLGGLLGAIAGILITPLIAVDYTIGLPITLKGIAAAILGGFTNPLGAVIGGLTLGIVEFSRHRRRVVGLQGCADLLDPDRDHDLHAARHPRSRRPRRRLMRGNHILVLLGLVVWAALPHLLSRHLTDLLVFTAIYTVAGIGVGLLLGQCGIVNLGQAAFYGIGAYSCAYLTVEMGYPTSLASWSGPRSPWRLRSWSAGRCCD